MDASGGLAWDARPQQDDVDELQVWMDWLASGQWSPDDFLREVFRLEKHDSGLPWDVLTTLEHYYHRELISHELFICVRSRLQKHLFEAEQGSESRPGAQPLLVEEPLAEEEVRTATVLRAGDVIRGRYRVTEILDHNPWGTLIEAVDEHRVDVPDVRRRISICLFDLVRSQESELLQRAYRLQSLSHPCIQKVFDADEHQGQFFVTLECLSGLSVQQLLDLNGGQRLSAPVARTIVRAVASALAYAHARDVYHCSIDTNSVVATQTGEIKLRGFELSGLHYKGEPSADRLGFARLAYQLLGGLALPEDHLGPRARKAALRQPPGLHGVQWNLLRDALLGKESPSLLTEFAGEGDMAAGRYTLVQALPVEPARRRPSVWITAGAVAATLAALGLFLVEPSGSGASRAATPTSAVAAATPPVAAPPVASPPVARPRVSSPTAALRVASTRALRPLPVDELRPRIELTASAVEAPAEEPFARVQVQRRGSVEGPVSFKWWTETGSAQANRDFLGIEPRLEWIPGGSKTVELRVPLLADPGRDMPRTFYVKIELTSSGNTVLGSRTLTQVSIQPMTASQQVAARAGPVTVAALP